MAIPAKIKIIYITLVCYFYSIEFVILNFIKLFLSPLYLLFDNLIYTINLKYIFLFSSTSTLHTNPYAFSLSGYNLTLHDVEHRDEGEYVCEVETYTNPIKQISTLNILIPPTVTPHPKVGR